jgi:hypothetical protein
MFRVAVLTGAYVGKAYVRSSVERARPNGVLRPRPCRCTPLLLVMDILIGRSFGSSYRSTATANGDPFFR